ncbi:hypothetical protein [Streptomyces sp. NPDC056713]
MGGSAGRWRWRAREEPVQEVKGRHMALFLGAFVAVVAATVVLL